MSTDVSLCMVTYNKLPFLKRSLQAILDAISDDKTYELLVWNNGSNDGTKEYLDVFCHVCPDNVIYSVIHHDKNIGLNAYGMIVPEANGRIIVTIDDDVFSIGPDGWEERFERVLSSKFDGRRFGYIGTDTINTDGGRESVRVIGVARVDDLEIEVGAVGGWFTATTKEILDSVGGFHTDMPPMHLEDADIQSRMWEHGYLCGTLINTKVYHARAPRHYVDLGCVETYREKEILASDVGISLEPIA